MRFREQKLSKGSLLAILMALSVLTTLLGPRLAASLRRPAQAILAPLADGGMYFATAVKQREHSMLEADISQDDAQRLAQENTELRAEVAALDQRLVDQQRQMAAIQKLDTLLFGPQLDMPCELIPARVVSADSLPYGQTRIVDSRDARTGLAVTTRSLLTDRSKNLQAQGQQLPAISPLPTLESVTAAALVGRLTDTGAFTARLQLITDRGFGVWARILRQGDSARPGVTGTMRLVMAQDNRPLTVLARGDGGSGMLVTDVDDTRKIQPGDWLVTSSDEPLMPAEVRIGQVKDIRPGAKGGFVNLTIAPFADMEGLRDVFIVAPSGKGGEKGVSRP